MNLNIQCKLRPGGIFQLTICLYLKIHGILCIRFQQIRPDQCDRGLLPLLLSRALVHRREVGVHIAGIAAAAGDLLLRGGDLAQRLGVVCDIRQDHEHMHILFKGQILRGGQGHTGGGDTLDGRVVCQVGEQHGPVDGSGALEVLDKELGFLKGDADGGEHHGEVFVRTEHPGLPGDLGRQRGVGQAGAGENGQLLAPDQGVQTVDGGNAGLDELGGVGPGSRVHGQAVDVVVPVRQDLRAAVDGIAHAVEHPAQHVGAHAQLQAVPQEPDLGLGQIDARRAFKQLDQRVVALDLQNLAAADLAVRQLDFSQLVIGDVFHVPDQHQGPGYFGNGAIFLNQS